MTKQQEKMLENFIRREIRKSLKEELSKGDLNQIETALKNIKTTVDYSLNKITTLESEDFKQIVGMLTSSINVINKILK